MQTLCARAVENQSYSVISQSFKRSSPCCSGCQDLAVICSLLHLLSGSAWGVTTHLTFAEIKGWGLIVLQLPLLRVLIYFIISAGKILITAAKESPTVQMLIVSSKCIRYSRSKGHKTLHKYKMEACFRRQVKKKVKVNATLYLTIAIFSFNWVAVHCCPLIYGLLGLDNIWPRYNYLKIWNLRVQKYPNT